MPDNPHGPYNLHNPWRKITAIHFGCPSPFELVFGVEKISGDLTAETVDIGLSHTEEPDIPEMIRALDDNHLLPPSVQAALAESSPIQYDVPPLSVSLFKGKCVSWGVITSASGLGSGLLDQFGISGGAPNPTDGAYNELSLGQDRISYAWDFSTFWQNTIAASCPWPQAPHCKGTEDPVLSIDDSAGLEFLCGGGSKSYSAAAQYQSYVSGHNARLTECVIDGCGKHEEFLDIKWKWSGAGWDFSPSGNTISVLPPTVAECQAGADCAATITAYVDFAGSRYEDSRTLVVTDCGGCPVTSVNIIGPTQTSCSGSYTYTAQDQNGNAITVTWAVESGGATINPVTGVLTPPGSNSNCANNSVISATYECPGGSFVTGYLSIAHNCAGAGSLAYITWECCYYCVGSPAKCKLYRRKPPCPGGYSASDPGYGCYDCSGNDIGSCGSQSYTTDGCTDPQPSCSPGDGHPCAASSGPYNADKRSAAAKAAGCCPEALL